MFIPYRGAAFLGSLQQNEPKKHLWIVLTDHFAYDKCPQKSVLLVNISTVRQHPKFQYDKTRILQAGEHPFIKHDSYVMYEFARLISVNELMENGSAFDLKDKMSAPVLERICDGLRGHPLVRADVLDFYYQYRRAEGGG